jgi:hypothetical protein
MTSTSARHQRDKVVRRARDLARSGQYPDLVAIIPELRGMEGFAAARARLKEPVLRAQIDQLCAMAREAAGDARRKDKRPVEMPPRTSTRA